MCAELTNVYAVQAHADHFLPMSDEEIRKFTGIRILIHSFIYPRVGFVLAVKILYSFNWAENELLCTW